MRRILPSLVLLMAITPTAVSAQNNCAARDSVVEKLKGGYGETFAGGGLQNSNRVFEVWHSTEKGTWTILMTMANGTTCIMASGTNWRDGFPAINQPAGIKS